MSRSASDVFEGKQTVADSATNKAHEAIFATTHGLVHQAIFHEKVGVFLRYLYKCFQQEKKCLLEHSDSINILVVIVTLQEDYVSEFIPIFKAFQEQALTIPIFQN